MTRTLAYATPLPADEGPVAWKLWLQRLGALLGWLVVFGIFSALAPDRFPTWGNVQFIAENTAVVGTAALGMTLIIIVGGIDLSVGSAIALVTVVVAQVLVKWHAYPTLAALAGVATGALCGLFIGSLVAYARLLPFVVTLGTWGAYRGLAKALAGSTRVSTQRTWLNDLLVVPYGPGRWMLLPAGVWVLFALALLVAAALRYTRFGRHVFAVGSNEQTARLCGVKVNVVKAAVYTIGGLFTGLAGVLMFGFEGAGDPTTAAGKELDVIAAVVIGGASLTGGEGSILGTLIGAFIMTTVDNGCNKLDWISEPGKEIITGVIIVLAVALDRLRHRGRA